MTNEPKSTSREPRAGESMAAVWSSSNHNAEMEALAVKGVLDSNGIPAMIVGPHMLPNLEFQVQVPEHLLKSASELLREARKAGSAAAEEAERDTE